MPTVTLARSPGFRVMVLPRSAKVSFVAAGPTAWKTTSPPEPTKLPKWVAGVPERVHQPVEAFVPFTTFSRRSVTYVVPAAPLLRPTVTPSDVVPQGLRVEAPDEVNPSVTPTGTPSVIAISTPIRVLESRFTSTHCPHSRDLFTQLLYVLLAASTTSSTYLVMEYVCRA